MQYVYMLRAGTNHYKIGVATNVLKRLSSIQTGNSNLVEVVTAKPVQNAFEVERQIHQRLDKLHTNGGKEWFELKAEDAIDVAVMINRMPAIDITDRLTIAAILEHQKKTSKSIQKQLDFVINTYQKREKPVATIEPNVYKPEPTKNDIKKIDDDELYRKAVDIVREAGKASTSLLQRKLGLGYSRAAKIIDLLEANYIISPSDGTNKSRKVITTEQV
jgi:DNA segregation ATPase FtsK/SpoIIIE-like protein